MIDGLAAPKDATTDENIKLLHTLIMHDRRRDLRSIASEVGRSFGAVQLILTQNLRYVKGFRKVAATYVDRLSEKDSARYSYVSPALL